MRQLESLIRIAAAFARMRLSPVITARDMKESSALIQDAMKQAATDPTTGVVDVNKLLTGSSALDIARAEELERRVRRVLSQHLGEDLPRLVLKSFLEVGQGASSASSAESTATENTRFLFSDDDLTRVLHALQGREEIYLSTDPQGTDLLIQTRKGLTEGLDN